MSHFRTTLFVAATLLVSIGTISVASAATSPKVLTDPAVTAALLTASGFTNVTAQAPTKNRFLPPNLYFHVKETVAGADGKAWGNSANLVAILSRKMSDPTWQYNNGNVLIVDLAGRTQARFSHAGYYYSVTGPDKTKVLNVVAQLKNAHR